MISVIIPTFNEKKVLVECLDSLRLQSFKDFETIIIDDGSTDGTLSLLKELKHGYPRLRFAKQKHTGAGAARNYGVTLAKGSVYVFVDADMTFENTFIKKLVSPILEGKTKGTFSKDENVSNWENVWARCWNINEGWQTKKRHPANYPDTQPVFRAILATEYKKAGGFEPGGYNDDWSLSKKLGYSAVNAPGAVFYHKNPSTLKEIFRHAQWVGKRKYKLGILGDVVALIRSSLPVSVVLGMIKSVKHKLPAYFIFKIIYDLGIFIGILKYKISGNASK